MGLAKLILRLLVYLINVVANGILVILVAEVFAVSVATAQSLSINNFFYWLGKLMEITPGIAITNPGSYTLGTSELAILIAFWGVVLSLVFSFIGAVVKLEVRKRFVYLGMLAFITMVNWVWLLVFLIRVGPEVVQVFLLLYGFSLLIWGIFCLLKLVASNLKVFEYRL